jgi:hypothetical protein
MQFVGSYGCQSAPACRRAQRWETCSFACAVAASNRSSDKPWNSTTGRTGMQRSTTLELEVRRCYGAEDDAAPENGQHLGVGMIADVGVGVGVEWGVLECNVR